MTNKELIFVLNTSSVPYDGVSIKTDNDHLGLADFFDELTTVYLPLLRMFERLRKDNVEFKMGLVLTPTVCSKLQDKDAQKSYVKYLDERIKTGVAEVSRLSNDPRLCVAAKLLAFYKEAQEQYEALGGDIVKAFCNEEALGNIELLATCATDVFLPLYGDIPTSINAQIKMGVDSYRLCFHKKPSGFWLPHLGYCSGVENTLKNCEVDYTILSAKNVLLGNTLPTKGIFYPVIFDNCVAIFPKDTFCDEELFGETGYSSKKVYLDKHSDIGYMEKSAVLKKWIKEGEVRRQLGYSYNNHGGEVCNLDESKKQSLLDGADFVARKNTLLDKAIQSISGTDFVCSLTTISTAEMAHEWREGVNFIEAAFRSASETKSVHFSTPQKVLAGHYNLQSICPCNSFISVSTDEETFQHNKKAVLSHINAYMLTYTRKAAKRMADMVKRFHNQSGLRERLLNAAAVELFLAQDSLWLKCLNTGENIDVVKKLYRDSVNDFTEVFEALGTNEVSTQWLTDLEDAHDMLPHTNYRIFEDAASKI